MVIRRLKIKNFGKIRDKDMELSPGINVLYGENESGKTTTHTFIRSMFYGVRRLRGKASQNDTYTKYEPWENPAEYGGILWFTSKGKNYRLTRNFYKEKNYVDYTKKEQIQFLQENSWDVRYDKIKRYIE